MGCRRKPKARRSGGRKRRRLGELLGAVSAAETAPFFEYDRWRAPAGAFDRQGCVELSVGALLLSLSLARRPGGRGFERDRVRPLRRHRVRDLLLHQAAERGAPPALEALAPRPTARQCPYEQSRQVAADEALEALARARASAIVLEGDYVLEEQGDPLWVVPVCGSFHGKEDIGRSRFRLSPWDGAKAPGGARRSQPS
jgi:hypothetical protein